MAPVDVPHVAHDMMLRFMGVNFTSLLDGSAQIPSAIGSDAKPVFTEDHETQAGVPTSAKTPQQDKAMWEGAVFIFFLCKYHLAKRELLAYYNAGSAAIVLVVVFLVIGAVVWCRHRRRPRIKSGPPILEEESIPLTTARRDDEIDAEIERRRAKGKSKETSEVELNRGVQEEERIFDVGDSDEDDYKR